MLSLGDDGLAGGNIAPCDAQRARVGRAAARMRDIERCVAARAGGAAEAMQIWEERRALWSARMCPPRGCRSTLATLLDAKRELLVVEDECKGRLRHVRELAACLSLVARGPRAAHRRLVVVSDSSKKEAAPTQTPGY